MKIRKGFVSNSSSSSFVIGFNGNIFDLYSTLIANYSYLFNLHGDYSENSTDVFDFIRMINKSKYKITDIDEIINSRKKDLKDITSDYSDAAEYKKELITLQKAKRMGVKSVICFSCGDSHGDECGTDLAINMDYQLRDTFVCGNEFCFCGIQEH